MNLLRMDDQAWWKSIPTMRPDIAYANEYVEYTSARASSVVVSALGISSLLPFLKVVCWIQAGSTHLRPYHPTNRDWDALFFLTQESRGLYRTRSF